MPTSHSQLLATSPIVLLHGAFHGGWCWESVRRELTRRGLRSSAPSCRGAGERVAEMTPAISINDWVDDVCQHIEESDLTDVVLVGHSFGGRVISAAAERISSRLAHLVYLDAGFPVNGASYADEYGTAAWAKRIARQQVTAFNTLCLQPPDMRYFGVTDESLAREAQARLTPMPMRLFESTLPHIERIGAGVPCTFIYCTRPAFPRVTSASRLARDMGFTYAEISACHDAMLTHPSEVADFIDAVVRRY